MPIIPMVLVNGSEGIGTGWSTFIPNYNPRDIIANLRRLLNDEFMEPMHPWYRGFKVTGSALYNYVALKYAFFLKIIIGANGCTGTCFLITNQQGSIERTGTKDTGVTYTITGIIQADGNTTLRITELPIRRWTEDYKKFIETLREPELFIEVSGFLVKSITRVYDVSFINNVLMSINYRISPCKVMQMLLTLQSS